MEFLTYLTDGNVSNFLLLLLRFSGFFAFFPFFDNQLIPVSIKGALVFFVSLVFFPILPPSTNDFDAITLLLAGFMEIMFGFCASLALQILFGAVAFAGDLMSFTMGFTMASAFDPISGAQKPIVAQVIFMLCILLMLSLNFHHFIFMLIAQSFETTPLGGFLFANNMVEFLVKSFSSLFVIGISMAFPIIAILLLSDIIFGMIMKTNPQFNILSIGLPIKIIIGIVAMIVVIPAIMYRFRNEMESMFISIRAIFFS